MYVTNMQEGDVLRIGDDILIYVRRLKGSCVRLAVVAPREMKFERLAEAAEATARALAPAPEAAPAYTSADVFLRRPRPRQVGRS